MSEVGDDNCRRAIKRVLQVWRDRCIYTSEELESLSQCLTDIEGLSSPTEPLDIKASPNGAIVDVDPPPTTSSEGVQKSKVDYKNFQKISTNLVGLLKKIGDPPSADEKTRRMIAAYPESIANPSLLRKIDTMEAAEELMEKITEAQPIVHAYCARLKNELADRRSAQKLFDDYMKALEESAERNLHLIDSVRQKINRLEAEKKEIAKHIESLPDLNEMLGSSSSSLPTLGELFT